MCWCTQKWDRARGSEKSGLCVKGVLKSTPSKLDHSSLAYRSLGKGSLPVWWGQISRSLFSPPFCLFFFSSYFYYLSFIVRNKMCSKTYSSSAEPHSGPWFIPLDSEIIVSKFLCILSIQLFYFRRACVHINDLETECCLCLFTYLCCVV